MLVEELKIKQNKGFGFVVFVALLGFSAWCAVFWSIALLVNPSVRHKTRVDLLGIIPFGSALVWGAIFLFLGLLFSLSGCIEEMSSEDAALSFWVVGLPWILFGLLLFYRIGARESMIKCADALLLRIAANSGLSADELKYEEDGRLKYTRRQVLALLKELAGLGLISYVDRPDGGVSAVILDSNLLVITSQHRHNFDGGADKSPWTCVRCGAPNQGALTAVCQYCQGVRK